MYKRQRCVLDRKTRRDYIHFNNHTDVNPSFTITEKYVHMGAFVVDWGKEIYSKEHLLISYNTFKFIL